ncbi:sensor histidine kinase [Pedobacter cryotolerans]|uniref:histidine kinase n=1 Tax=Pedobacter cryotolerans TaxID=2571270 RepID=A0A4U1C1M1_9SPHI|nr:PAS domain S-box protein [Pedobacter cryotolerans]TKB99483.1 PAS domain S-box protein [Pedobacter cryotolerans]
MERKSNRLSRWFLMRPKTTGFLSFLVLLFLISLIVYQRYHLFKENKQREITNILNGVKEKVEQSLKNSYTVTLTLALTLDNNGVPRNFEKVASNLIKTNPDLQAVQLVPKGIIKYIYPLKGNEQALNLNLYKSPPQTVFEAKKAIETRKMYFQGPVKLNQGGIGVIGRLPLYINDEFWGFSAVVIKLETLFKTVGIDNSKYKNYQFQFSKINEFTHREDFFLPMPKNFADAQSQSIVFPDGDWKLYVVNTNKYETWLELISAIAFGLALAGLSSYLITRLIKKQLQLRNVVEEQASKLIDAENKYKKIFDHAAIGIARVNSLTGEILEANHHLCEFLGYNEQELYSKKIKSIIYDDDLETDRDLFKQLMAGEIKELKNVKRYVHKNGEVIWGNVIITPLWDEGEEPTHHIVIIEDITKRKEEEQILRASQNRIESLINTIDGIVWEGDLETHVCSFISKKVEDILGYTVEEWKKSDSFWFDHVHPDDQQKVLAYLKNLIPHGSQLDEEYRMIASNGSIVWIRDIVTVVAEANQSIKLRGIMIDVTNKVKAEQALTESFNLVNEQNKRLLNFSYIVSHNLRSHASNILGISTLIQNANTDEDRDEMIQLLKTVAENLNETLFNLNNIVNIQTSIDIIIEPLKLNDYIKSAIATQNSQILLKRASIKNFVKDSAYVNFNKSYLESILLNLISNALRYSHPDRDPVILLNCVEENGQIVLSVEDNGVGIDLNKHGEKIFNIYQTFNGNADARGFGLFISKNQVEAMGGKIEVESEIDKGTIFKIYFKLNK